MQYGSCQRDLKQILPLVHAFWLTCGRTTSKIHRGVFLGQPSCSQEMSCKASQKMFGWKCFPAVLWQDDIIVTRAPGRLDVMGGIADYSGSLVLQLPLAQACHVAVQTHPLPQQRVWRHMQSRHVRTSSLLCLRYLPLLRFFVLARARKRLKYQSHASMRAFRQDLAFWGLSRTSKPAMRSDLTLSGDCSSSV